MTLLKNLNQEDLKFPLIQKFNLTQVENLKITQKLKKIDVEDTATSKLETLKEYKVNFNEHIDINNFEVLINHLDAEQEIKICELINRYSSIFAKINMI